MLTENNNMATDFTEEKHHDIVLIGTNIRDNEGMSYWLLVNSCLLICGII